MFGELVINRCRHENISDSEFVRSMQNAGREVVVPVIVYHIRGALKRLI